ncbi:hypothetical protein CKO28_18805 [Rhodovibrio sodomensis]|uniref:Uncharacterized protein n=1 Tax=Rhodovibrio sodomensis TaxID=1088 RepID=A0ABS1DI16_9PROT|nr:hypothetical protein [Rhodovibrio sodomensis]
MFEIAQTFLDALQPGGVLGQRGADGGGVDAVMVGHDVLRGHFLLDPERDDALAHGRVGVRIVDDGFHTPRFGRLQPDLERLRVGGAPTADRQIHAALREGLQVLGDRARVEFVDPGRHVVQTIIRMERQPRVLGACLRFAPRPSGRDRFVVFDVHGIASLPTSGRLTAMAE